ncbi:ATP-binding protein [Gilvimarinus sp. SDUM040013]|uniref:ATP-binding protein n=1 Tax=Gilvimarinus gilvus TaxID=3058038 RepID=A0ABU4RYF8_9GAMM|nr:ATP-binding protein [Gilvimarinus sp. SDUM040013]MDO3385593.1 ATP-binding protein [Gilvimarinus sp. SDUM040013]MDX6849927.1 ATP-binding protein [Gilvimarinus sp. SDUM040013]
MTDVSQLFDRLNSLLDRIEPLLVDSTPACDWQAPAFYWRSTKSGGYLQAVYDPHHIDLEALQNVDQQKKAILRNTRQFAQGLPANNILLTGARGTGKSTLIKSCWYLQKDLVKLIEIDKPDLGDLGQLLTILAQMPDERFIVYCDDLSFEEGEHQYKALKSALDGSIIAPRDNVVFYATSNRRHLLPHKMSENLETDLVDGDIRPGDAVEEKTSLSERFGLWLSFYPFRQEEYMSAAQTWVESMGGQWSDEVRAAALRWSMARGSRSGRVAWQFARDYVGNQRLQ